MADTDSYGAMLLEMLAPLGPVQIRRMFGGAGVFLDGLMFGLVSDDVLYFKADDGNRAAYEAESMAPFTYAKQGGRATLTSYWRAPERLLDEHDELEAWARAAVGAARRANLARATKARPSPAKRTKV